MNAMIHQIIHQRIDHTMAIDRRLFRERLADNSYVEVTLPVTRVTGVHVTFIGDFEQLWCKGGLEPCADLLYGGCHLISHGKTLRNGLTEVAL